MISSTPNDPCRCKCNKRVKLNLKFCCNCGQLFASDGEYLEPSVRQKYSIPKANYRRYAKLQKLCCLALDKELRTLLYLPKNQWKYFFPILASRNPRNLKIWQEAAEFGIAEGQYLFGRYLLYRGESEEAIWWLQIAASQESEQAKRVLGDYLLSKGKSAEGLRLLKEAADADDEYACERLAYRYEIGDGVPQSKKKSSIYRSKASDSRHNISHLLEARKSKTSKWWRWWA